MDVAEGSMSFEIVDMQGKLIGVGQQSFTAEDHKVTIGLDGCNEGFYILKVSSGNRTNFRKFLVKSSRTGP